MRSAKILQDIKNGSVDILFVSPEKFVTPSFFNILRSAPPLSLVCVDESHCVSVWSHNFRPTFLRISSVCQKITQMQNDRTSNPGPDGNGPHAKGCHGSVCVLALTATATPSIAFDISRHLQIRRDDVIMRAPQRSNLCLSASEDPNKLRSLSLLLRGTLSSRLLPSIVYCAYQRDVESVCSFLRGDGHNAAAYHAGMEKGQ